MARGMHGPAPIPILRQACRSPSSSHLAVSSSYRWFAASHGALRTELRAENGFIFSTLDDWKTRERKLELERNGRQQQQRSPAHQESRHMQQVGQGALNSRPGVECTGADSSLVPVSGTNVSFEPLLNGIYEKTNIAENVGGRKNTGSQCTNPIARTYRKTNIEENVEEKKNTGLQCANTIPDPAGRIKASTEDILSRCFDVSNVLEHQDAREWLPSRCDGIQMTEQLLDATDSPIDCKELLKHLSSEMPNADEIFNDSPNCQPLQLPNAANVSNDCKEAIECLPSELPDASNASNETKEILKSSSPIETSVPSNAAKLGCTIDDVIIVDNTIAARTVLSKLQGEYKDLVHACDTEVADIDVKKQSPVGHGRVICFSIYCGPNTDFGNRKSCVWVDVMDSNVELLNVFKEYFEDSAIKKVWHNFSFDRHVLANHGIKVAGFYADTMQLARLWHSGRKGAEGSYSLESLTSDFKVMNGAHNCDVQVLTKKTSMMELFGVKKLKKDGTEGSITILPPVEELQKNDTTHERWICYSSGDALCTWRLWESLHAKLMDTGWIFENKQQGSMYTFYDRYWRPFGELLADMEEHGMLVDREYLAEIEKIACKERAISESRFRKWVAKYCSYSNYLNVGSDMQIRQLLYGGYKNTSKCRVFTVLNIDGYIEEGKKVPRKYRTIEICGIDVKLPCHSLTSGGLPAVTMQALRSLAGKVSIDYARMEEEEEQFTPQEADAELTSEGVKGSKECQEPKEEDISAYGHAYDAFNGGEEGKEACKALAALCEISAIDCLISGFIQPLQGGDSMGCDNRVHCSLNLNTETGRLSARRPNLQNQPALEKDRYKIRQAFVASPGNLLIVADYGQLELRLLAHLADCKSMLEAFQIGGDFHSRTAMNMYDNVKTAVENGEVLLEWEPKPGEDSPPAPLLKNVYAAERRKAKMLNFSIAYGKTARGLSKDWKVTMQEAQDTVKLWYRDRPEVRRWQAAQKKSVRDCQCVYTLLGRARHFPDVKSASDFQKGRVDRAAINTPVQGSAADVAMLAMIELWRNVKLQELGWKLLLQVHDEIILEGPAESATIAKELVVDIMSHPFDGKNILKVDLVVDAKYANSWYAAK